MTPAWVIYSIAVTVLCAGAAYAGGHFCRLLRMPERWVWLAGMVTAMVLSASALVQPSGPAAHAAAEPGSMTAVAFTEVVATSTAFTSLLTTLQSAIDTARRAGASVGSQLLSVAAGAEPVAHLFTTVSLAITGLLLLVLVLTMMRVRRARSTWRRHSIGSVPVLVSPGAGPALVGLLRPAIVVPSWLLGQPVDQQELVVRHEREHQRAGDHLLLVFASMAACALPWNVALWWMLRRLRLAVELDCDARVLRAGTAAGAYGSLLLDMAGRAPGRPFLAPAIAASRTHLERRLLAMTEKHRTARPVRAAAAGSIALLLGLVACAADLPTASAIEEMDVATVREEAVRAGLLREVSADGRQPLLVLDGVVVAESAALEITPDNIESIEVVKGEAARTAYGARAADGVIFITTRSTLVDGTSPNTVTPLLNTVTPLPGVAIAPDATIREIELNSAGLRAWQTEEMARERQPIVVVDGVIMPMTWQLNSLSPTAIERIEIVKAEAARRQYGERGANGVIHITTKPDGP